MDPNIQHFLSPSAASSFEAYNCIASDNPYNSDDTALRLDSQTRSSNCKRQDSLFCSSDGAGSVPSNAYFPKEMQRKWVTFHEAQSTPTCLDDDCGLVLALGRSTSSSYCRCSSLPKTSSTVSLSSSKSGWGLHHRAASGFSNQDSRNITQSHHNVSSTIVSCTFTQTKISEDKLEVQPSNCSGTVVTKSVDMDHGMLRLGLPGDSLGLAKASATNSSKIVSQSNTVQMLGHMQETPANGVETPTSLDIPIDEGSTSGRLESRGYIPSLTMASRLHNSGLDIQPPLGNASFMTEHPLQKTQDTLKTPFCVMTTTVVSGNVEPRGSLKTCKFTGCQKGARGSSGLCISHGGGHRCQKTGCTKGAESRTVYCKAHGGGRRCQRLGCTKSAEGRTDYCIGHGGGRRCSHEGCTKAARGRSGLCIRHGGGKRCQNEGCTKSAEGHSGLCISHGGGRRCQYPECTKGAQGSTIYCKAHGGGKRCIYSGCNKGAEGSTPLCKGHGGGKRCMFDGGGICPKSVHGGTQFCVAHGGGKRCAVQGCTKSARGRTDFCVKHGGGKRCKFVGCGKSAQGSTDFCKAHGGGKRCQWGQEGSVYAQEVIYGRNGEIIPGPCDRFARGKIGLCAAHAAFVQDNRAHGGKALGPGIGPGLFHGLACSSVSNADSISFGASALSGDTLWDSVERASRGSNCVEMNSSVVRNMDQNVNKDVNDFDMETRAKMKDGQEDKLILPFNSELLETNHLAKWKLVKAPTSIDSMNIDKEDVANEKPCGNQSAFVYPNRNVENCFNSNLTHGGSEVVGSAVAKQGISTGLAFGQMKNYCQVQEPGALQPLIQHKVLVPLPLKKDLNTSQIEKYSYGSGSTEVSYLSLPEGRVHGGNLMSMLSKHSKPGHVGFVPFLAGALDPGKTSQGA